VATGVSGAGNLYSVIKERAMYSPSTIIAIAGTHHSVRLNSIGTTLDHFPPEGRLNMGVPLWLHIGKKACPPQNNNDLFAKPLFLRCFFA
jgi:hypothetical protein